MPQRCDMNTSLAEKVLIQFIEVQIHFRKFHSRIGGKDRIDRHTALDHHQQHRRTVFPAGQGYSMIFLRQPLSLL